MEFSNPFFTVILLSVTGVFVIETVATLLNVRALSPTLPEEFADVFDAEAYAKSQLYARESERFGILASSVRLVIFLAFWWCGGFRWLDGLVRGWTDSPVWQGLAGIGLLYVASTLAALPFAWWDTFRIEARYGFNKTTPATFVADQVKALMLAALLGLPLLALLIWVFGTLRTPWFWAWLAVMIVVMALQYIAPRWLMPLFNKFTPLADGELKDAIHALAKRCRFPVRELFVIDGSRRSTKANAFFAGFGKNKRIALYDTLIANHPQPELLAVLAHEIGHFKCRHIWQRMAVFYVQLAAAFLLMGWLMNNERLFAAFGVERTSIWLSFIFFMLLLAPVQFVTGLLSNLWSRKHEYEADSYAAHATGSPRDMITGLKRLARDSLANLTPHPLEVCLHYSHPPMLQRIAALRRIREALAPQPADASCNRPAARG